MEHYSKKAKFGLKVWINGVIYHRSHNSVGLSVVINIL